MSDAVSDAVNDAVSDAAVTPAQEPAHPLLRVVKGDPTVEELAALVAVIVARRPAAGAELPAVPRSEWATRHRTLRGVHRHGPGAWRASGWPS